MSRILFDSNGLPFALEAAYYGKLLSMEDGLLLSGEVVETAADWTAQLLHEMLSAQATAATQDWAGSLTPGLLNATSQASSASYASYLFEILGRDDET